MTNDTFFGRRELLELLEKRIRDLKEGYHQNIAIIGDEMVGKTALLCKLLEQFCDNHILLLYLEIRPEPLASFARRFMGVLLYTFLGNSGISLKEELEFLLEKSDKYIPETVQKMRGILAALNKKKKNNIFTELLSLCDAIYQETGKFSVVIMDEFHHFEQVGVKNLYQEWSKLLVVQKTTKYIIASSLKYKAKNILSKNLSLLFGNFEVLTIEPFDIQTSEAYLTQRLQGVQVDGGLFGFIVYFTGGYPFYLEVIADALRKTDGQQGLVDILQDLLFDASGILNQRFSNYLKHFLDSAYSQDYLGILHSIAKGQNRIRDIAHALHKSKAELVARINQLLEMEAIARTGDFVKINDRIFSFWLRFVHHEKLRSLTFDAKNQKALFRENIEQMIREFFVDAEKPIAERLSKLLSLFSDDVVQMERKRLRLDHFREVKPVQFSGRSLRDGLLGRSGDTLWIVGFKDESLTEEDICEFSRECKKYRHKLQQKIIIGLKDIETNARLRAMEEKILTWDIRQVNQLLDLYSQPRVIV